MFIENKKDLSLSTNYLMAKIKICMEAGCQNVQTTEGHCRLHYLKNWKNIRDAQQKKAADKLNKYVEGICKKSPDKYVDVIRREIRTGGGDLGAATQSTESTGFESEFDEGFSGASFQDDESFDKIMSRIKVEKDF